MKRLVKVVGIMGGVLAVVWAMRDRFISLAASREPEPPTFRATVAGKERPLLEAVDGIGPVFAGRLKIAGIDDVAGLASSTPDSVAEAAGVSVARARTWIEHARSLG